MFEPAAVTSRQQIARKQHELLGGDVAQHEPAVGQLTKRRNVVSRFDLATSYNLGRGVSIYARATNLLDRLYQDALGYPALGRDVRVGMNYRFSGRN